MGAVGEAVPPAPTFWLEHVGQASGADGGVGANGCRCPAAALGRGDDEIGVACGGHLDHLDCIDPRQWRRLDSQALDESIDYRTGGGILGRDLDALRVVAYPAADPQFMRDTPDKGPVANTLDDTRDPDAGGCRHPLAEPRSSQASQSPMPSPVFAETRITSMAGLTRRA